MAQSELDTIVAPATPLGRGALAIVRIDGPRSGAILEMLGGVSPDARIATLTQLRLDGEPLDECSSVAELPDAARGYVEFVERELEVEVTLVGTGAERSSVLTRA